MGVINGMIGSLLFLLPYLSLQAGYAASFIAIVISGAASAFSSWIYLQHLGEEPDIGYVMKKHLRQKRAAKLLYDIPVWLNLICTCLFYFQLMVIQW